MRQIVLLSFLLVYSSSFACICGTTSVINRYNHSDFVADITIVKNYPNEGNINFYKSDIKINQLFKGRTLKSIFVYGRSDGQIGNSCSIFFPVGTNLIAYSNKDDKGIFTIGRCSNVNLDQVTTSQVKYEIAALNHITSNAQKDLDVVQFQENSDLRERLKKFNGLRLDQNYALFQIEFNSDFTVKSVIAINGFGDLIDKDLSSIFKEVIWIDGENPSRKEITQSSKLLFGIYYHPQTEDRKSFLSFY